MTLIHISRGGLIDTRDGAHLSLHLWLGKWGWHLFRRPFGVERDYCARWRDPV